jgi:hypothetical protein
MKRLFGVLATLLGLSAAAEGPDFSSVYSLQKAQELYERGDLEKVYLFPLDAGGQDVPQNIVYLPLGLGEMKNKIDGTISKMAEDGSVSRYSATPEYKGNSFIPSKIVVRAWDPGDFTATVEVW